MLKEEKGITIIALIITIIVMLILVGVTINIAINGGLLKKTETAKKQTEKEVEEEQLMAAIVTAYDVKTGVVEKNLLQTELAKQGRWAVTGEEGRPYGVTSPKGNAYTVTKDGKISEGWIDNGDGSYTKGDTTVKVGETTYTNAEVQEKLGATGGTYNGTWTVIGVEGDKIKLLSTGKVGNSVRLGKKDPNAYEKDAEGKVTTTIKSEIKDYNSDNTIGEYDVAVWSYAHAVETLNKEVKTATGIESARSITVKDIYDILGEENVEKGTSYGKKFNYYYDTIAKKVYSKSKTVGSENWSAGISTSYDSQTFVKYPDDIEENSVGNIIQIYSGNPNASAELAHNHYSYTLTDEQKGKIKSLPTGYYWIASPSTICFNNNADFYVCSIGNASLNPTRLFRSKGEAWDYSHSVLAVVTL